MLSRSSLETQKLELLSAMSELKLQQAALERDNLELRDRLGEERRRNKPPVIPRSTLLASSTPVSSQQTSQVTFHICILCLWFILQLNNCLPVDFLNYGDGMFWLQNSHCFIGRGILPLCVCWISSFRIIVFYPGVQFTISCTWLFILYLTMLWRARAI
jgi:hypothetical protein